MIILLSPQENSIVSLQTSAQKAFIADEERRAALDGELTFKWYDLEKEGSDRTLPLPVTFRWEEMPENCEPVDAYFYLLVSENADMSNAFVYITRDTDYKVFNLKVGTKYYWRVQKHGQVSNILSFNTALTLPRCLKIDFISNVRDIGGYKTDNGIIRQGLAYRGGEFEPHMQLCPDGAAELCRLNIKTELDMRGEVDGIVQLTAGEAIGMKRIYVPSVPYQFVFREEEKPALNKFFKVFCDKSNYPIYFHCWGGADRTGTAAFVLGAFLGMSYEELVYEYEFTSLSFWGTRTRNYCNFIEFVKQFMLLEGETLKEKGKTFLSAHARLTDEEIQTIHDIFIKKG